MERKQFSIKEAVQMIRDGGSPLNIADFLTDPNIQWVEHGRMFVNSRLNVRTVAMGGDSTPGAMDSGPNDSPDAGVSRKVSDIDLNSPATIRP